MASKKMSEYESAKNAFLKVDLIDDLRLGLMPSCATFPKTFTQP